MLYKHSNLMNESFNRIESSITRFYELTYASYRIERIITYFDFMN